MPYKRHSTEKRLAILRCAKDGGTEWIRLAEALDVPYSTANNWAKFARRTGVWDAIVAQQHGGARRVKIEPRHVRHLLVLLEANCRLTLERMALELELKFGVRVCVQTVKNHLDGELYTIKKVHREPASMDSDRVKDERQRFALNLLQALTEQREVLFFDETNFNIFCARTQGWSRKGTRSVHVTADSKGANVHVIACISRHGLEFHESRFGSFKADACNDTIRKMLRHIGATIPLHKIALVCDNAPVHTSIEQVFEEEEFAAAKFIRLGPYSPMLNPIENVFSVFKAAVKRFLADQRAGLLATPRPGVSIEKHRVEYLYRAADLLLPETVTAQLCDHCYEHALKFIWPAIRREDMPVGD